MRHIRELTTSLGLALTFHRAFDLVCSISCHRDQKRDEISPYNNDDNLILCPSLEQVISLNCDRLLTSGGDDSNVLNNVKTLRRIVTLAGNRIKVIAAAGITADNVADLIVSTGVGAVHAGSSVTCRRNNNIEICATLNESKIPELIVWHCVDSVLVRCLVHNAKNAWSQT